MTMSMKVFFEFSVVQNADALPPRFNDVWETTQLGLLYLPPSHIDFEVPITPWAALDAVILQ
jgi:hypothetical protein